VAAFKRIYQMGPVALDHKLWSYATNLKALKFKLADPALADITVTPLNKGDGGGLLIDAALQACPTPARLTGLARAAAQEAAAHPGSAPAAGAGPRAGDGWAYDDRPARAGRTAWGWT
jgi:hypothetical protein